MNLTLPKTTKTIVQLAVYLLLFCESIALSLTVVGVVKAQNYLSPEILIFAQIFVLLLVTLLTYALLVLPIRKPKEAFHIPFPIAFGFFIVMVQFSFLYALALFVVAYLLMLYDLNFSVKLAQQLIKVNPKMTLRFPAKGLLFVFSLAGVFFVLVNPTAVETSGVVEQVVQSATQVLADIIDLRSESSGSVDYLASISAEIRAVVMQYQQYVLPLVALLIFGFLQLTGYLVFMVFIVVVDLVFVVAKKVGYFTVEYESVQREVLSAH